ncbi:MAG: hypothetical protein KGL94_02455 [Acidobacteriota bacterium]|nr:hypothetical protein [Acidobacteriota bacterium]
MKRDTRMAANTFRARVFGTDASRLIGFVCECGDPGCRRTVALTLAEYLATRPGLLLHDDHVPEELEATG